jgi:hypothetical protein
MIGAHDPKHCICAHRHAEPLNHPRAGFTAERQVDTSLYVTKADCSSRVRADDLIGSFCEDTLRAMLVGAPQPPNLQTDTHRPTLPQQVSKRSPIVTVRPRRRFSAGGAGGCRTADAADDGNPINAGRDLPHDS